MTDNVPVQERPTYRITLRPGPNIDGVKAIRRGLKILGRRLGLTAISVEEVRQGRAVSVDTTRRDEEATYAE
jgi:hypothetical protein